jgi:2-hydroxy-3-keto-5-methylthiopentenyl-1-phosphate phosphatase
MTGLCDLRATSVFLDFDGTVSVADSGRHVLARLGRDPWREVDAAYTGGLIGSREALSRQWPLVEGGLAAARTVAREVEIDAGFAPLVAALRAGGAEVTIVSDGFGFYASEVGAATGVDVLTNSVDETGELVFPFTDRCCPCSSCGVCKQAPLKDARRRGRTTVLVGDGVSDRKAALLADVVFAKDSLADWCDEAGVDYRSFARLADVQRALVS